MSLYNLFFLGSTFSQYRAFIKTTFTPRDSQNQVWEETAQLLKHSSHWRERFKDSKIPDLDEFDITTYQAYEASLKESFENGLSHLNGEKILFWALSCGTTGKAKPFPITQSYKRQFQRTVGPLIHTLCRRFPKAMDGQILYLAATHPETRSPSGIEVGQISNFNYRNIPVFLQKKYVLPYGVFQNVSTFQQYAPLYALSGDISSIYAVTPFCIQAFMENLINQFDTYLPYISGEKNLPIDLPPLRISKERKNYLNQLSNITHSTLKDVWPKLQFICCWKSSICCDRAHDLEKIFQVPVVDSTYSASEGWMTVSIDESPGGIFHPGAHVVEFIEYGKEINKQNLIKPWSLEKGKNYEVFLTTAMGMIRYRLKDVIQCTDYFNRSPMIKFCHKAESIKFDWLALGEDEIKQALEVSGINMDPLWFFTPNRQQNGLILITDIDPIKFNDGLKKMHQKLLELNDNYLSHTKSGKFLPIRALQVDREKIFRGVHAQFKPKLIVNETPDYVPENIL